MIAGALDLFDEIFCLAFSLWSIAMLTMNIKAKYVCTYNIICLANPVFTHVRVALVKGERNENAQRQLRELGLTLRRVFKLDYLRILKDAAYTLLMHIRMMVLSKWDPLQGIEGLKKVA